LQHLPEHACNKIVAPLNIITTTWGSDVHMDLNSINVGNLLNMDVKIINDNFGELIPTWDGTLDTVCKHISSWTF